MPSMSDDNNSGTLSYDGSIDRRAFVAATGAGVTTALAGCSNSGSGPTTTSQTSTDDGGDKTSHQTSEAPPDGGKPRLGMGTAPANLNPLKTSSAYSFALLDNIYSYGTAADPKTLKPVPWAMKDWTVNPDNVGSSSPTVTATLRDDLTFNDGEPVTAEDVKFTVEYVTEQGAAGSVAASQFRNVDHVEVDKPEGTKVHYYFSQKDRAWLSNVVGNIILPKHRWKDISDYSKYSPRKNGGPVGSGPFELSDYKWDSWFELSPRSDDAIPWNGMKPWLHDEGPFIDTVRIELFGSTQALNQAALDGDVDQTFQSVTVDKAAKATDKENLEVSQAKANGWQYHGFNTRRVPLDDVAFRQFLSKMLDKTWVTESLFKGIGAQRGTWSTPKAYQQWHPDSPSELDGSYEGIPIPDLSFPGDQGSFGLDQDAISAAREWLVNHDEAKYDYSIGSKQSGQVASPDGKAIYVDGQPIGQAHTDNDGNGGKGPLVMTFNPPKKQPKQARTASKWVEALQKVGVPVSKQVMSQNSMLPKIYKNEDFDMYEMGWTDMGWLNTYYEQLFGEPGADLDGSSDALLYNSEGYTGAQELIDKQAKMMEVEPRQPVVKKILAQIYHDAPANVTYYSKYLQPYTTRFTGRVQMVGGISNHYTWLNIRKNE
jgi:peptide/nickel transport system substrate-binding protein